MTVRRATGENRGSFGGDERLAWAVLGLAMVLAAGLLLYLGRGTTYSIDELPWVIQSPDLSFADALTPYNGT